MKRFTAALTCLGLLAACAASSDPPSQAADESPRSQQSGSPSPTPSADPIPVEDGAFAFVAIGDSGSAFDSQYDVADRMCRWRKRHRFDHVFTTGDNIYPAGEQSDFQEAFFAPYDCLLDKGVRWHAALGNHDIVTDNGRPELDEPAFGIRARNYVVRIQGVRFVIANSNAMKMPWLRRNTRAEEGDRWTIVIFHHPVFSAGDSHGPTPGFAERLTGLFSKRGVDLVLNGHDHVYSLSKPVGGVRYIVTGGGGATLNGCRYAATVTKCVSRNHFLYITVNDQKIRIYALPARGQAFDTLMTTEI